MLQFPNLYVIDADQNLDGPESAVRKFYNKGLSYSFDQVNVDEDGSPVPVGDCYERCILLIKQCQADPSSQWVGLDGLSAVNEYIIQKIMKEQRISYMEGRNWSTFKSDAYNLLFAKLRHCGKNVIVPAHTEEQTRNHPKEFMVKVTTGFLPYIQGSIQQQLGGLFTDVWLLKTDPAPGGKMETTLFCDKLELYKDLKNSVGLPAEVKNPTYELLHQLSGGQL